jgi:hypothetical protein
MKYFKNSEIAKLFSVSNPTVGTWIKQTLEGKRELELIVVLNKHFISKSAKNIELLTQYADSSFKFRPSTFRKTITPDNKFLKNLDDNQRLELKKSIEEKNSIPLKFAYFNGGADEWDKLYCSTKYYNSGMPINDLNLLSDSIHLILGKLGKNKKINIIDLGSGNGKPLINILTILNKKNILQSYNSIDISPSINEIALTEVKKANLNVPLHEFIVDLETSSFAKITYELTKLYPDTINCIFLMGGTLGNFENHQHVFTNIENSLNIGDFLFLTNKHDTKINYQNSDYLYNEPTLNHILYAVRSLGIEANAKNIIYNLNEKEMVRDISVRLSNDYTLDFPINNQFENLKLYKGQLIKVWKHQLLSLETIKNLASQDLMTLCLYVLSADERYMLSGFRKKAQVG